MRLITTADAADAVCEMLTSIGSDGVSVSDPGDIRAILSDYASSIYADPSFFDSLGDDVVISAYFAEFPDGIRMNLPSQMNTYTEHMKIYNRSFQGQNISQENAIKCISSEIERIGKYLPIGKGEVSYCFVEEQDWANNWKKDYKAFKISDRVTVSPSWEKYDSDDQNLVIFLDPGSAFGTGTHESTALCAQILDHIVVSNDVALDLGCGSGILSILSEKLGASYVEAIDIDRLAVAVAEENVRFNASKVLCHTGDLTKAYRSDYTLIVANIIADVLIPLAVSFEEFLSENGRVLISGIIADRKDQVCKAYEDAGFILSEERSMGDWYAFLFKIASKDD